MSGLGRWERSIRINTRMTVLLLVDGQYQSLENVTGGKFLTKEQMQKAVESVADPLIEPPEFAFDEISVVELEGVSPATFLVDFRLWTVKAGRSDLVLKMRMYHGYEQALKKEILAIEPATT